MVNISQLMNTVVLTVSGHEIGIIGYVTPETQILSLEEDVRFSDEIEAIK